MDQWARELQSRWKKGDTVSEQALIVPEAKEEEFEVHLVARNTGEMDLSRAKLKDWLTAKLEHEQHEADDLTHACNIAVERKWATSTLKRQVERVNHRLTFYRKCLTAVEAGYTIVPNFPVDLFAIRVKSKKPSGHWENTSKWGASPNVPDVSIKALPEGEGRYVDNGIIGRSTTEKIPGKEEVTKMFDATSYAQVEFPVTCARPVVMQATAEAMALRCFDAIGICPKRTVKRDPLIIGQIVMPKYGWQDRKTVSFLIAWHLDLRTL